MNFDARQAHKRPKVPEYLDLKLCFVGYAFAGKKTQAERLKEKYENLDIYHLNDIVSQALTFYESNPNPIEQVKYYENGDQQDTAD